MNRPRMQVFSNTSKTDRVLAAIDGMGASDTPIAEREIDIQLIDLPESQPRRYFDSEKMGQLTTSIKEKGILEPLLVRPKVGGRYELVAGERRYRAATNLGLANVPVTIKDLTDTEALEVALIENLQREDLNPVEEVEGVLQLLSIKLSIPQVEVSRAIYNTTNRNTSNGTSSGGTSYNLASKIQTYLSELGINLLSFATNRLPLLNLPEDVLTTLRQGQIEYTKARAIATIKDETQRQALLKQAISEKLSLSQLKARIAALKGSPSPINEIHVKASETVRLIRKANLDLEQQQQIDEYLNQIRSLLGVI
jgi:ParB family transcriptional regulator, chromosome partitioning protein